MEKDMSDINAKIEYRIRLKSQWIKEEYQRTQNKSEIVMSEKIKDDASRVFLVI